MSKWHRFAAVFIIMLLMMPLPVCSPVLEVQASPGDLIIRLWGGNRYETACAISREGWESAKTVILTKGEGADTFTDALAASALSKIFDAPTLFFSTTGLDENTINEMERLKVKTVYILGVDDAVYANIKKQLEPFNKTIKRITGKDRYETAVEIASEIKSHKPFSKVILTTGAQFQYALMAAPYGAQEGIPILFTENKSLSPVLKNALESWLVTDVEIIGSESIVSEAIASQLKDMGINTVRVDGDSIQDINLKIIQKYFPQTKGVAIGRDDQFIDTIAGLSLAAKKNMPIVLVGQDTVSTQIASYIKTIDANISYIFGSAEMISGTVVAQLFPDTVSTQSDIAGNTPGNIVNGGNIAVLDGWIYFSHLSDGKKLYKSDLNGNYLTKLSDNKCKGINISEGWIYYVNESENNILYKIRIDGTEEQQVLNEPCFLPCIVGDWIYYGNYNDNRSIYRVGKDGRARMKLNNDASYYINVVGDYIYYSNLSDNGFLYKMKTDGSCRIKLCEDRAAFINVSDGFIYYSNENDGNSIYRMSIDGGSKSKICNDPASFLNLYEDNIYYINSNENSTIYSIKKDGSEKRFLNFEASNTINIANGWIYYYSQDDPGFFKIKHDGSNRDYVYHDLIKPVIIPQF